MIVSRAVWTAVGVGSEASLLMQNTGATKIGYIIVDDQTAANAVDPADGTFPYFLLRPTDGVVTVKELDVYSKQVFVRAIGAADGVIHTASFQ
jgi:hypothetical protein